MQEPAWPLQRAGRVARSSIQRRPRCQRWPVGTGDDRGVVAQSKVVDVTEQIGQAFPAIGRRRRRGRVASARRCTDRRRPTGGQRGARLSGSRLAAPPPRRDHADRPVPSAAWLALTAPPYDAFALRCAPGPRRRGAAHSRCGQSFPLRHDAVPRVLGRVHAAVVDPEAGQRGGGQQRGTRQGRHHPAARPARHPPRRRW